MAGCPVGAVRLAVEIPAYQRAAEVFRELTPLALSKSTLHRLTSAAGQPVAAQLAEEAQAMLRIPNKEEAVM